MHLRRGSALLALAGGLLLLLLGVLGLVSPADWHQPVALVGYALALVALAVLGFSLVATAPVWLGIIVAICTPLLVASVWQALAVPLEDRVDEGAALVWLLAGVLALVLAALEYRASRAADGAHGSDSPLR